MKSKEIEEFQLCLRSLLNENKCDIYCTGSNAKMLSMNLLLNWQEDI